MTRDFVKSEMAQAHSHSIAVDVADCQRTLYVSGLTAYRGQEKSFDNQVADVLSALRDVLHGRNLSMSDVVKLNIFVVQDHDFGVVEDQLKAAFPDGNFPAGTMVRVYGLAIPPILVEIDAVAVA